MSRYTAFISYRHTAPDAEIAKKLHTMIENFGVPAALKRASGRKKMGRVFRDQDELPLSSDLGDDIHRALEDSEWLICICSPRYLASRWCMEEVRYFLSLGRRDRILTVMVEGEPKDSFPEALCFETVDSVTVEREPLAADVRADSLDASLKKLKNEKLRILAPILGVNYDDLKQRARRRRTRIIAAVTAAAFALLSGFLGYAILKNAEITKKNDEITAQNEQITEQNNEIIRQNDEITEKSEQIAKERNEALIAESKWLSKSADEALENKDRNLSLLLSLEALPTDFENPERPVVEDALRSLRSAILYDKGDSGYHAVATVEVPGLETYRAVSDYLLCFSRKVDGYKTAFSLTDGEELTVNLPLAEEPINCFITKTGSTILVYPDRIVAPSGYALDGHILFDDYSMEYVQDGNGNLVKMQLADHYESFQKLVECDYRMGGGILLRKEHPHAVFSWYQIYDHRDYGDVLNYLSDAVCLNNSNNGADFVVGGYMSREPAHEPVAIQIYLAALQSGQGPMYYDHEDIRQYYYLNPEMIAPYMVSYILILDHLAASKSGSILAAYGYNELCLWAADDAEMRAALNPELIGKARISDAQFSPDEEALLCLRTDNGGLYLYDCNRQEIRLAIRLGLSDITGFQWSADGDKLLVTCSDGTAHILSASTGAVVQTLDCPFAVRNASYAGDHFLLLRNGDRIQIDELKTAEEIELPLSRWIADEPIDDPGYSRGRGKRIGISPDGSTIWIVRDDGITLYDAETLEIKKSYALDYYSSVDEDLSSQILFSLAQGSYLRLLMSQKYAYLYIEGQDSHGIVRAFDPSTGEEIASFRANYPHTYQYKEDREIKDRSDHLIIGDLTLNKDGSLLMIDPGKKGGNTSLSDPCIFVYSTDTHEECWHIGFDGVSNYTDLSTVMPFAANWEGEFSMCGYFLDSAHKVLCCYSKHRDDYNHDDWYAAFEVRDERSGELCADYSFAEMLNGFYVLPDQNRIVGQTADNRILVLAADTGEQLAAFDVSGKIKSVAADAEGLWITYAGLTSASDKLRAFVADDGAATPETEREPDIPASVDGRFGPYAFHAGLGGLYDIETGERIMRLFAAEYSFVQAWNDGSKLLFRSGDYYVIIRYASPAELREIALTILDGRTMTDEQREQYFLQHE